MSGVKTPGWPEPSLLGSRGLIEAATRAQRERLEDHEFWQQIAERAIKLRDVMNVSDLAALLDALVTANHRHTQLLKTLSRELIDDVDKLSLMEAAVVANAYAHFSCLSEHLISSLAEHTVRLLNKQLYTEGGRQDIFAVEASDPEALAVLCRAFASLKCKKSTMLKAVNAALVERIDDATFTAVSRILAAFADLGEPFDAPPAFWAALQAKVPGSKMFALCPTLRSMYSLGVSDPALYQAIGSEILGHLRTAQAEPARLDEPGEVADGLLGRRRCLPAFAAPGLMPEAMLELQAHLPSATTPTDQMDPGPGDDVVEFGQAFSTFSQSSSSLDFADAEVEDSEMRESKASKRRRWYNAVSRRLDALADDSAPKIPYYVPFSADEYFTRNLDGSRIAQALEGLGGLEKAVSSKPSSSSAANPVSSDGTGPGEGKETVPLHVELLSVAGPALGNAVQGLSTSQLAHCTELLAVGGGARQGSPAVKALLRESIRRLSNFSVEDLRRLHAATHAAGLQDPYLERAQRRRFPKALRKELRCASQT